MRCFSCLLIFSVLTAGPAVLNAAPFKLTADQRARDSAFGTSVDLSNDGRIAIVGASHEGEGKRGRRGAAHIFERRGGSYTDTRLVPPNTVGPFQEFGAAVAIAGDGKIVVVGSPYDNQAGKWSGAVYVYTRGAGGWSPKKIRPRGLAAGDYFGEALGISDDGTVWAAGASKKNAAGRDTGAVYVFRKQGTGWRETMIRHPRPNANDTFGHEVALSGDGDWLAVGAHTAGPVGRFKGQVFLFKRAGASWRLFRRIQPPGLTESAVFGSSLSLSSDGGVLAVSAPQQKTNGRVFVYAGVNAAPDSGPRIIEPPSKQARFGEVAIAGDGDSLLVGSTSRRVGGAAFHYRRSGSSWSPRTIQPRKPFDHADFGCSVALTKDGEAYIIGARAYDWFGAAFLFED